MAAALAFPAICNTIKPVEPPESAYVELLKNNGYDVVSYDISALRDSTYSLKFIVREYQDGKLVNDGKDDFFYMLRNRTMLSAFLPEDQAKVKAEEMADADKGIYSLAERIDIGLFPAPVQTAAFQGGRVHSVDAGGLYMVGLGVQSVPLLRRIRD